MELKKITKAEFMALSKKEENYLNNYFFFLRPLCFFNKKEEIIDSPKLLTFLKMNDEELEQELVSMKSHDIFLTL